MTAAISTLASGSFLVQPGIGLMVWTLVIFAIVMVLLKRTAFPAIANALDKRQHAIEDSIDHAEQTRKDADELLKEYRERLTEARAQSDEIVTRARKAAETVEREARDAGQKTREEMLEQARKDVEAQTSRAIAELRAEVAELTVLATEKVTRRTLTGDDQRRLVNEALDELDFSALSANN